MRIRLVYGISKKTGKDWYGLDLVVKSWRYRVFLRYSDWVLLNEKFENLDNKEVDIFG